MKKFIYLFIWFIISTICHSQITFSGTVTSEYNLPIVAAVLIIENPSTGENLGLVQTNESGIFLFTIKSDLKNFKITVNALEFEKKEFLIDNISQKKTIVLKNSITQLEEVKIESKIVERKGDTLTYNLKAFEGKEDRILADVLRKIPGLTVDESGLVKYQGAAINKFYVEGKDLMAGAYGNLNMALPKDAVSKIQILQQHQPVKILQDFVPSYQAGINVKLKKGITFTGNADVGAGANDKFVRQINFTPIFFSKKYQFFLDLKTNNSGLSVQNELNTMSFDNDFEGLTLQNETGKLLSVFQIATPRVDANRFLFNDINLGALNFLTNLSQDWELRTKVNYFSNIVKRNEKENVSVKLFDSQNNFISNINYNRENYVSFKDNQFNTLLDFIKNTNKSFFKNSLQFHANSKQDFAKALLNNTLVNQQLSSPGFSIQNSFSTIIKIKKHLVNFKTNFNFVNDNQIYSIDPFDANTSSELPFTNGSKLLRQQLTNDKLTFNHEISYLLSIKKFVLAPSIAVTQDFNNLQTAMFGQSTNGVDFDFGTSFQNNLKWTKNDYSFKLGINFKNESINFRIKLPLTRTDINVANTQLAINKKLDTFIFEPSFNFQYIFNSAFSLILSGSVFNNFGDIGNHPSNVIFSALNTTKQNSTIQKNISYNLVNKFLYKIIDKNIEIYIDFKYAEIRSNNSNTQNFLANGQIEYSLQNFENISKNYGVDINLSKSFVEIKSSLRLRYSYAFAQNFNVLNNQAVVIKNNSNALDFNVNSNFFKWLTFNSSINLQQSKRSNNNDITNLKNVTEFIFFPIDNHSISCLLENYHFQLDKISYKNNFFDLSYLLSFNNRKIEIGLVWKNIFNTKFYEELLINDFSTSLSRFQLRPSQILLNTRFGF